MDQKAYEEGMRGSLAAKAAVIERMGDELMAAATPGQALGGVPRDFLQKVSEVIAHCENILGEHLEDTPMSPETLAAVGRALKIAHESIDSAILNNAVANIIKRR